MSVAKKSEVEVAALRRAIEVIENVYGDKYTARLPSVERLRQTLEEDRILAQADAIRRRRALSDAAEGGQ